MKVLTICPVKGNPALARNMVDSWLNTRTADNTIVLGCDIGDSELHGYKDIKEANKVFCKAGSTITEVLNSIYLQHPDYDFYHITNDDVSYVTKGWDTKMVNLAAEYGHGVFYGNDCLQGENLPTFPFISGELVRAVGWLQMPTLNRYCGDVIWKFIAERCNCLYYMGGIIISHDWKGCVQPEINTEDMAKFAQWLPFSHKDILKVKEIL